MSRVIDRQQQRMQRELLDERRRTSRRRGIEAAAVGRCMLFVENASSAREGTYFYRACED